MKVYGLIRASADAAEAAEAENAIRAHAAARGLGDPVLTRERLSLLLDERCAAGDAVVLARISDAARSMQQIHLLLAVCEARRIALHVAAGGLRFTPSADAPPGGDGAAFGLASSALYAGFEREILLALSREALAAKAGKTRSRR